VRHTLRRLATRAGLPSDQARHLGLRMLRQSFTTLYLQAVASPGLHSSTRHAASCTTQRSGEARDPDPSLWPRGRPHCHARRPQHATRHTRPRLFPAPQRDQQADECRRAAPSRRAGKHLGQLLCARGKRKLPHLGKAGTSTVIHLSTVPFIHSFTAADQPVCRSVHSLMHMTLSRHRVAFTGGRAAGPRDYVVGEAGLGGSEGGPVAGKLGDSNGGVWHLNDRDTTHDRTMVIQWKGDLPHPTGVRSPTAGRLVRLVPPRCLGALERSSPGNHETAGTTRASRRRAVRT
jgi:hypothetical protein